MKAAKIAALEEMAKAIKDNIPWDRYPKLAEVFRHRPHVNIYWLELAELMYALRNSSEAGPNDEDLGMPVAAIMGFNVAFREPTPQEIAAFRVVLSVGGNGNVSSDYTDEQVVEILKDR